MVETSFLFLGAMVDPPLPQKGGNVVFVDIGSSYIEYNGVDNKIPASSKYIVGCKPLVGDKIIAYESLKKLPSKGKT